MPQSIAIPYIDICWVIDESGSMSGEHAWMATAIPSLENGLVSIGYKASNIQWGLVGFGRAASKGGPLAQLHTQLGTMSDILTGVGRLFTTGSKEDGYEAIKFAVDNMVWRDFSVKAIILVTDENRDIEDATVTQSSWINSMNSRGIVLNSILNIAITGPGTPPAVIGVSSDGTAYSEDGNGGWTSQSGLSFSINDGPGGAGSAVDYAIPTLVYGGAVWSLLILRSGGKQASSFASAFTYVKVLEISGSPPSEETECEHEVSPESIAWFCFKEEEEDDNIDTVIDTTDYTIPEGSGGVDAGLHFRITFYADPNRSSVVDSAFSLTDQNRWSYRDSDLSLISLPGCGMPIGDQRVVIVYNPKILPSHLIEKQHEVPVSADGTLEKSLVCGVTYYVSVDVYSGSGFVNVQELTYIAKCGNIQNEIIKIYDEDAARWICSGQGQSDQRVTETSNNALYPAISGNSRGLFKMAWEDHRFTSTNGFIQDRRIYSAHYNSNQETMWSSGQGFQDNQIDADFGFPIILTDFLQNYYLLYSRLNEVYENRIVVSDEVVAVDVSTVYESTLPEDQTLLVSQTDRDVEQYLKIRVYDQDVKGSFVRSDEFATVVVEDGLIRLDVNTLPNAYAIRLRNDQNENWTDWLPLAHGTTNQLPNAPASPYKDVLKPHQIDSERFVIPWVLSPGNGIKRVSGQLLTLLGVTKSFSMECMLNMKELAYSVKFFSDSSRLIPLSTYQGSSISKSGTVYIEVEFDDKDRLEKITTLSAISDYSWLPSDLTTAILTFNVVQEGIEDQYNLTLTPVSGSPGVYSGSFIVSVNDGVINKDGTSLVVVNLPDPLRRFFSPNQTADTFTGDKNRLIFGAADPINAMNLPLMGDNRRNYQPYFNSVDSDTIINKDNLGKEKTSMTLDEFKNLYSTDDPRFVFGNPKQQREDK